MNEPGRLGPALVLIVAIALCLPLWEVPWFTSHEGDGYVVRALEYAAELERGNLYPRWCPDLYGGFGSPFFVFYAPLVYAIAAFTTLFGASVLVGLKLVVTLASIAAGLGCYALVRGETGRSDAALLAAAVYLAAPYRLADLYVRGDLAEFTALALLPGVLFVYRSVVRAESLAKIPLLATLAALGHAAMILSHTLIGLWGTELVALALLCWSWSLWRRRAASRILALCSAFAFALSISSVYTGPALLEKSLVRIDEMTRGGGDVANNWLAWSELSARGMYDVRGLALIALCAGGLAVLARRRGARRVLAWLALSVICVVACLPIASGVWKSGILPFGAMIQFPWRLLGFGSLGAAVAAGLGFALLVPARSRLAPALAAALGGGMILFALPTLSAEPMAAHEVMTDADTIGNRVHAGTGMDEYLPKAVKTRPKAPRRSLVSSTRDATPNTVESNGSEHRLEVDARAGGSIALGLYQYPGWRVETLSGPAPVTTSTTPEGYIGVVFPKPGRYALRIHFGPTALRLLFTLISLASAFTVYPAVRRLVGGKSATPVVREAIVEPVLA